MTERTEATGRRGGGTAEAVAPPERPHPTQRRAVDDVFAPDDAAAPLPPWLQKAIDVRRDRWTRVDTAASALIAAHLVLVLVLIVPGSLYLDDLRAQGYATGQPFLEFVVGSNGTHFAPLPRTLDWIQSRVFPLQHEPAIVLTALVRLLLAVAFWRLLRRLLGPRPVVLVPLAVLLVTPAMVPATAWFRQSITLVACAAAMVWALDAYVSWVVDRRRRSLLTLTLCTVVAVCCYEKGVAIPLILLATHLAVFAGRGRNGVRPGRIGATAIAVGITGSVVAAFLVVYRNGPYDQGASTLPTPVQVARLAWDTLTRTLLPMLLGGPWTWTYDAPYAGVNHPGTSEVWAAGAVFVALLSVAVLRSPTRVLRASLLLLAALAPSVTIVAVGRFDSVGALASDVARLWADLVPFTVLALALATLGWRVGVCRTRVAVVAAQEPVTSSIPLERIGAPLSRRQLRESQTRPAARQQRVITPVSAVAGLAVVAVVAGSVVSTVTYAREWWENPTGDWIRAVSADLALAEADPRVLATPLPEEVMPTWVSTKFPTSAPLLQLLRPDIRFHDGDGATRMVTARGTLRPFLLVPMGVPRSRDGGCLATVPSSGAETPRIRMTRDTLYVPGAQVEVGLLLRGDARVRIRVQTTDGGYLTPTRYSDDVLTEGAHTVRVPVPLGRGVRAIRVSTSPGTTACVTVAQVWAPYS